MSQITQMNNNEINKINVKSLTYHVDLAHQLFSKIEQLPWAMLLRSGSTSHIDSRFDILVAQPIVTLTTHGHRTTICEPEYQYHSQLDPFKLLSQLQNQYLPDIEITEDLPFVGGVLGYFAYDLGRRVEQLPTIAEHDLSAPDMAVGLYQWAVIVDHQKQSAYVVGVDVENAWHWLNNQPSPNTDNFELTSPWCSNMNKQQYQGKFEQIQRYLLDGDCYQINLAQRFQATYQGSEWHAYQKLEAVNSAPFSAFIRLAECAIISVSPERFMQVKQGVIETKPIKGTRPRNHDPKIDAENARELACAEKDQAENLMIVDLLRNDVGRVAKPGSVHVPKLFDIESFPAVHHLVSTIRAELASQYSAADLLRASFPGGSITGAPKVRAMEIIEELEPHRRSAYCGSIGYISRHGQMDTSITIRTLVAENNQLYVWAGGGIVADSQWEAEYQETLDKLSRILPILT
ncbi:aminodeoxychorismate synthase component 1 [Vibrio aestuarianus]|uniref:aminodeoxychorismate synthase component 1 n=1 Tax=Vibrio aestuarianus TaxID=28171 RepID=UPI00237C91B3|nr:aminodeoxychorismate synthase component 1 [Vibrio aestuarianus]MDE1340228.1 aminodeoxychorismate synthase component 1 [Vibrio aestuarianus]